MTIQRSYATHIAFSDESHWNLGRFRSVGLVTLSQSEFMDLTNGIRERLANSNMTEF